MNIQTDQGDDWTPFGRPLFNDPASRRLSRVGVVDVGSNSVRLVVFDGAARSPAYFYNEKIMCGLGAGMSQTGVLNPQGRERARSAMHRFALLAEEMNLPDLTVVATAAVRDAADGPEFCDQVMAETGLKIWTIDGREEARLSAQGVLLGWPGSYGLVCDIGGSSMELAAISKGEVTRRVTSSLGPLKLREIKGGRKARLKHISATLENLQTEMGTQRDRLFLVGGSWRAIARIDMLRRAYPLHVLHEYRMTSTAVSATGKFIRESNLEDLRAATGISASRMELVPYAAEVLSKLVRKFKPKDIAISSYGIREGMLYDQMPQILRDRDPLIEAAYFAEAKDARLPGFGKKLYYFIHPLFRNLPDARRRIIRAACLMHDVSWRAHPDYRAAMCFENATRANLGGLKHSERVYLGLALLHRYSNKRDGTRFDDLFELLKPELQIEAEIVGKAMRFGAMMWMQDKGGMGELKWRPKKRQLEFHIGIEAEPLFGEVAQTRLEALRASLNAKLDVHVAGKKRIFV